LRVIIAAGKFHGVIAAQTPIGCLMVTMRCPTVVAWNPSSDTRLASSANHSMNEAA